ncbi:trimethylamine transporter-like [Acropora palmata]|uniref:trimethylamine transporter-like n=1 Tax=Acropora palmata TaxID=6131 RepID=UPI003DA1AE50
MEAEQNFAEKVRWFRFKLNCGRFALDIRFNPVVSILSAVVIWAFVIWCSVDSKRAETEMTIWMQGITRTCTWVYVGSLDVWTIFVIVLYFSKYGNMKLGKPDDKPDFGDATYFTMLFAAGIGVGLFYFGVAEPVFHYASTTSYKSGNRYYGRYNDNQRAQDAMNLTLFHWGIHAWTVYVIVGLLLAFVGFRKGLPMTIRSCFYPLVGEKIFGWIGDAIDILSVCCTMFGVCTSLGLGCIQLNTGFSRVFEKIEFSKTNQIIIIWCVTACATASVVSGLKVGIRRLSEICFTIGMFIMLIGFFFKDTEHILNVYVQSIGYYMQNIVQLGFHTDAFAQLGNAPDGKQAQSWMNDWTIFYWGWWIAWSPFVGMFIAKISKGRTIKQFINGAMTAPILYTFLWFCIFGSAGLKMEREAEIANITCDSLLGGKNSKASMNGLYRLSCRQTNEMWFDVMDQYGDLGVFLSVVSLIGIIFYFVTSSDSGSLVIDCLSANGDPDPPITQRVFWALTEGACATSLLYAGGSSGLKALRSMSIASGVPYAVLLSFMCVSLWRAVKMEAGDLDQHGPQFSTGLLDSLGSPTLLNIRKVLLAVVAPWYPMGKAAYKIGGSKDRQWVCMLILAAPFYLWILLLCLEPVVNGISYVGWTVLFGFFAYATAIRHTIREKYNIYGSMVEDFFAVMITYPFAAIQMEHHVIHMDEIDLSAVKPIANGVTHSDIPLHEVHTNSISVSDRSINTKCANGSICPLNDEKDVKSEVGQPPHLVANGIHTTAINHSSFDEKL